MMLKVNMYVKIVLTVIAISLMVIAFRPMFNTPAEAGGQVVDINIAEIGGYRFVAAADLGSYFALPVKIIGR